MGQRDIASLLADNFTAPIFLRWSQALDLVVDLALQGPAGGTNPQVGCLILEPEKGYGLSARQGGIGEPAPSERFRVVSYGWHRGAGTSHAEVDALTRANELGREVTGRIALVSLQPCNSTGRTGPCARALKDANIAAVFYLVADPAATRAQSDEFLTSVGISVTGPINTTVGSYAHTAAAVVKSQDPILAHNSASREREYALGRATSLVHSWLTATRLGRPYVIAKQATSLDGKIAAPDGTSQWITGPQSRAHAHRLRSLAGAILVGTQTAIDDNPSLTARDSNLSLYEHQPLRTVMGKRALPPEATLAAVQPDILHIRSRDPRQALKILQERSVTSVIVEGGAQVSAAFFAAGLVDEVHTYLAPIFIGAGGRSSLADLGIDTLQQVPKFETRAIHQLGNDVLVVATRPEHDGNTDRIEPKAAKRHSSTSSVTTEGT